MKKLTLPVILAIIIILLVASRVVNQNNKTIEPLPMENNETVTTKTPPTYDIRALAQTILLNIEFKKMENILPYVGQNGVHFKLYYTPNSENETTLNINDFQNFFTDTKIYTWGIPPSGIPIGATKANIYKTIFDKTYSKAPNVGVNEPVLEPGSSSNIEQLTNELYSGKNIMYVEYYYPPIEEGGLDWSALSLVFEQVNGKINLIGIFNNTWTP
ncbi:hypothetical protein A2V49_00885 [candidate division WWE3 bacterium RBG_19FT_COMBO_34_6]|uniref:Uncharacterized protein n=1 Tax=candidate division WWE3 bacterium RBG_19FT_COMBO_34_6 TaxID=1802612 RepID=A0A1F4UKA7_UNCKA|nr:MAG: hypothetical protein A2V49_00885 [candidate division WWE3 bacterium RBG_19FT_COMBO_34_6]